MTALEQIAEAKRRIEQARKEQARCKRERISYDSVGKEIGNALWIAAQEKGLAK